MQLAVPTLAHAAILSACGDPCLHPGDHLKDRIKPCVSEKRKKAGDAMKIDTPFGTWMAKGAEWITIGKYKETTIIYLPSMDSFYFASPETMLSPACPDRTVFLTQFVVDDDSTPRILVYDLVRLRGVSCVDMHPRERYACLQQMGQGMFGPMCTLQWVGDCRVLSSELQSGKFKVPHPVKGVIALSSVPGRLEEVA